MRCVTLGTPGALVACAANHPLALPRDALFFVVDANKVQPVGPASITINLGRLQPQPYEAHARLQSYHALLRPDRGNPSRHAVLFVPQGCGYPLPPSARSPASVPFVRGGVFSGSSIADARGLR